MSLGTFRRRSSIAWVALVFMSIVACSGGGRYVWYSSLPRSEWGTPSGEYVIGIGDVLNVRVYEQETLVGSLKVRSDGRVSVSLIGEVVAAGKHPSAFAQELETRLKRFIVSPRVTVNVEQAQPPTVTVVGEVKNGGAILLEDSPHVLQALAKAGGLSEFADEDRIFVIRQTPAFRRIRFTYDAIMNNENGAASFMLRSGDVVVVE